MNAIEAAKANGWNREAYNEIDAEVVDSSKCDECGNIDLEYIGLRKDNGSYRAFAVCPICNNIEEF